MELDGDCTTTEEYNRLWRDITKEGDTSGEVDKLSDQCGVGGTTGDSSGHIVECTWRDVVCVSKYDWTEGIVKLLEVCCDTNECVKWEKTSVLGKEYLHVAGISKWGQKSKFFEIGNTSPSEFLFHLAGILSNNRK